MRVNPESATRVGNASSWHATRGLTPRGTPARYTGEPSASAGGWNVPWLRQASGGSLLHVAPMAFDPRADAARFADRAAYPGVSRVGSGPVRHAAPMPFEPDDYRWCGILLGSAAGAVMHPCDPQVPEFR